MKKIVLPIKRFFNSINTKYKSFISNLKHPNAFAFVILYFIVPFLLFFVIQSMELKSVLKGFQFLFTHFYAYMANTLLISATFALSMLSKRRPFWIAFLSCLWIAFGIANLVLLCNRVTPFTASDLFMINAALDVLKKYFNNFQIVLLAILIVAVIVLLVVMFFKAPKYKGKINYLLSIALSIAIIGGSYGLVVLGININQLEGQFAELSAAYRNNGFVYCFINSLVDTGVSKPKDYSPETMLSILDSDKASIDSDKANDTPNIIFIQLETFFNIQDLNDVTFSDKVLPNFTKLQEKNGGYLSVPVIGAGTVNTEFEILTGMCMDDFGAGEYPFKSVLQETCTESLAYNLKTYGYNTFALHDNTGTFYERNVAYANLGFDHFTSVEYMQDVDRTPMGWAKDYILTEQIMKCLKSTKGHDLVYTVSVQGHGGYNYTDYYDRHISVKHVDPKRAEDKMSINYYANQLWEMDDFVGQLVEELSHFDEKVILVMYGDHLPSLDIKEDELDNRNLYQTDYTVYANYDFDFGKLDMSADELSAYLLKKLGMSNGVINNYRQHHQDDPDFHKGLHSLEYDMLYGDHIIFGGEIPYEPTEIKFGLDPIYITNVIKDDFVPNTYYIIGEGFTSYSKVFVNDTKLSTKCIDRHTLKFVSKEPLVLGDSVTVWQSRLSSIKPFIYNRLDLEKITEPEAE